MAVELLPLCSIPKIAIRDGYTGATARLWLPYDSVGSGEWFASGQQYTFPGEYVPQQEGLANRATNQKNPFVKAAGVCL